MLLIRSRRDTLKRKIAILGLVFFIVNLLTPVATVNATEITDNINTIDESFELKNRLCCV